MNETTWLTCTDPQRMLKCLANEHVEFYQLCLFKAPGDRKLRLFAVACARHVWHLLTNARSRQAVEVAERFADGLATEEELDRADWYVDRIPKPSTAGPEVATYWIAHKELGSSALESILTWTCQPVTQAALLRDVCGNPFRPVEDPRRDPYNPHVSWLTPTVVALASAAYEERPGRKCKRCNGKYRSVRDYSTVEIGGIWQRCPTCHGAGCIEDGSLDPQRLAVLSDALEEAGCDNQDMLSHLRSETALVRTPINYMQRVDAGPHVRGCWVLDLLLGKE